MKKIVKEIIGFDEAAFCGELAYGYSSKKEAIKAIELETGEKIEHQENMQKLKVIRRIGDDGEEIFTWADTCKGCGQKIKGGVWSWADFS